jgi:hypothetical protein
VFWPGSYWDERVDAAKPVEDIGDFACKGLIGQDAMIWLDMA